jgi:hypothetical protein
MTEQGPTGHGDPGPVSGKTGDPRVDSALAALDELDRMPVHEHAAVVEDVHRSLQDALADDEDEDG